MTAIVFVGALFLPLLGTWLHWDPVRTSSENRGLAPMPHVPRNLNQADKWSEAFLNFYRDHFGFRRTLIRTLANAKLHGLELGPRSTVVFGKEDFLFYRFPDDPEFAGYRGLNPLTKPQLDAWQRLLELRHAWLATRGIAYLVVIPPEKQTVYGELLPDSLRKVRNVSHLDQLLEQLRATHSPVRLLDLRPALFEAKRSERVYRQYDLHWNEYGGFVGYQAIMKEVRQALPNRRLDLLQPEDIIREPKLVIGGDLAEQLNSAGTFRETILAVRPRVEWPQGLVVEPPPLPQRQPDPLTLVFDRPDPGLPRLVMFRDSFCRALLPLIARSFSHGVYRWQHHFDFNLIETEKPDLVISEFVERNLDQAPPDDPKPPLR